MIEKIQHNWEMHCHSHYSDGQLSCPELFELAGERNINHLVLTDHDTAKGYRAAIENQWVPESLNFYAGTELSCVWRGRTIHVVGVNIDAFSDRWLSVERAYEARREKRFQRILYLMGKAGFDMDEAQIRANAGDAVPARPHIADYMVNSGQVKSIGHVYKRWLGQGKAGDVKQQWPDLAEATETIVQNGGMAILAHPHRYKLTWTKAKELLDDFTEAGGQGLEVSCVGLHPDLRKFLVEQARSRELWVGGGSDFHTPKAQWIQLGCFPTWPKDVRLVKDWLETPEHSR
jgi:predicted metal-dependent phosphoesterase TrpH